MKIGLQGVRFIQEATDAITNLTYIPPKHGIKEWNRLLWNVVINISCGMVSCPRQSIVKYNGIDVWSQRHVNNL